MTEADYEPAAHYDRVTDAWRLLLGENLHYGVFPNRDDSLDVATATLTELMVDACDLAPDLEVLDVGCGNGTPACDLAAGRNVRVTGITTSPRGAELARETVTRRGLTGRVSIQLADATDTGLPAASFDRIWVLESSHLMRDKRALIAESSRLLRPGGRLALCDIVAHRTISFDEVKRRREEFVTLRTAFGDAHMEQLPRYREFLEVAGMTTLETRDLTAETLPTFAAWRANAERHRAALDELLGSDGLTAFVRSTSILEQLWRSGTFGYALLTAVKPS